MKLALLAILSLIIFQAHAQDYQNKPLEYRVVAVSHDSEDVVSASNTIAVYLPLAVHLPSAFSPNGDGLNDTFGVVGEGIESYKLTVFNRWGEVLFHTTEVSKRWDGSYKGQKLPEGSYNYEVVAYGKEIGEIKRSGRVMLIK